MDNIRVSIAKSFSITPGPRYRDEGEFSGEQFREDVLEKAFLEAKQKREKLIVDLDGTIGYSTSFLEEVFGGLARSHDKTDVKKTIEFISEEEPYLKEDIEDYIDEA